MPTMLDSYYRSHYQKRMVTPVLDTIVSWNLHPYQITLVALVLGIASAPAIAYGYPLLALILMWTAGYLDTVDGSLARSLKKESPAGAVFDIVADRAVEFAIILGLFLADPASRGLISLLMLGSVLLCVTSFLVVGIFSENTTNKSFYYSPGIMERTEAFLLFSLMVLFPSFFTALGVLFFALVILTAIVRIFQFAQQCKN